MAAKIDGKKIIERIKKSSDDRKKVSLYLSETLFESFKRACSEVSASRVMEELMKDFVESVKRNA